MHITVNEKASFHCRIHGLEFQYPADWHGRNLHSPGCPICMLEENLAIKEALALERKQKNCLLDAIEIKQNGEGPSISVVYDN